MINAWYVRAKSLTVGYTIPQSVLNKIKIDKIRVYASANEPFVLTNVKDGLDPENDEEAGKGNTVPFNSSILFGIDIAF